MRWRRTKRSRTRRERKRAQGKALGSAWVRSRFAIGESTQTDSTLILVTGGLRLASRLEPHRRIIQQSTEGLDGLVQGGNRPGCRKANGLPASAGVVRHDGSAASFRFEIDRGEVVFDGRIEQDVGRRVYLREPPSRVRPRQSDDPFGNAFRLPLAKPHQNDRESLVQLIRKANEVVQPLTVGPDRGDSPEPRKSLPIRDPS